MSIIDKIAAVVTPIRDEEMRAQAAAKARVYAASGDWLSEGG